MKHISEASEENRSEHVQYSTVQCSIVQLKKLRKKELPGPPGPPKCRLESSSVWAWYCRAQPWVCPASEGNAERA